MECDPIVNAEVEKVATPEALTTPVPRVVEPSRKVTKPVAPGCTTAEKVTDWPNADGLVDDVRVTTVAVFPTVTRVGGDVAGLLFASPEVAAVMESTPRGSDGTVRVATPLTMVADPNGVVPFEKVTVPVTPVGTVSVIVSGVSMGRLDDDTTGGGRIGVFFPTIWVVEPVAGLLFVSPP